MNFSIVITTYNRLTLLKRAVRSACRQTFPCEVVVVDDCSTDGTQEYMQDLCSRVPQVIYHRNSENFGHSESVNQGVQIATGDWIKPLDDDDYLAIDCIEVMVDAIALRPQAVLCSAQALQVDENERPLYVTYSMGQGLVCYIPQEDIHRGMLLESHLSRSAKGN
ncbi:MAG: glycosyltransferase family 2 protein, partial [Kamptonema sp. SIO4C4]|nr:glycosyltransferase family 2 protein [Kamptonema sp. SIO4C4]